MRINPYLHITKDKIENPLTDTSFSRLDLEFALLKQYIGGEPISSESNPDLKKLKQHQFLIADDLDLSDRFYLKYVSIETHSVCNQGCYFCPVSIAEKDKVFMSDALFDSILTQLDDYAQTLEGVFLNGYNEPTLDKRLYHQLSQFKKHNINVALNSNATGLVPKLVDKISELNVVKFLSINLSTLDRVKYKQDRQADHLPVVLRNVEHLSKKQFFPEMQLVVLGDGDDTHEMQYDKIRQQFENTAFNFVKYAVNDRTGNIPLTGKSKLYHQHIIGCDQTGSRVIQHLHITPDGKCIICCQDYYENSVIGDLNTQTVQEIMSGSRMKQIRKWTYGIEDAPAGFICRHCEFAIPK